MRRPGWRKERGTQLGASRSRPRVRESSAWTMDLVLDLTIFRAVIMFINEWATIPGY